MPVKLSNDGLKIFNLKHPDGQLFMSFIPSFTTQDQWWMHPWLEGLLVAMGDNQLPVLCSKPIEVNSKGSNRTELQSRINAMCTTSTWI